VPLPVPGHRHRVEREHLIPSRDQGSHPRTPLGLDPDLHPARSLALGQVRPLRGHAPSDQGVQLRYPGQSFRQPPAR